MDIKTKPVSDYLLRQGRFKHLTHEEIKEIQKIVDEDYARIKKLSESGMMVFE